MKRLSDILCDEVLTTLRRIMRAVDLHSKHLIRNFGVTSPQLIMMQELRRKGPLPTGEIAKTVHLSHATVTEIVNRLEKRGFIRRNRGDGDKRQIIVTLTGQGHEVLKIAPPPLQQRFVEEFAKLEEWEQLALLAALRRVAAMMEAKDLDASPILVNGPIEQDENVD